MFADNKEKNKGIIGNQQNRITEGTVITGDFSSKTGLRIDGIVEGTVKTTAKVVVGEKGHINGTLECENADVEGRVSGTIHISGILTLKATAYIEGNVTAEKLSIEPGAVFNATCVMKGNVKMMPKREESASQEAQMTRTFERKAEQAN